MIQGSVKARGGAALLCLVLTACYSPTAKVEADAMTDEDTATYLILTDQFDRVRNVLKQPAKVCIGVLPEGRGGGLALVPPHIVERLEREQAALEPKLDIVGNVECLAYYVTDKAFFTPEQSDVLAFAGALDYKHHCGAWIGGLYDQGTLNRSVNYDIEVENGVAKLIGGEDCRSLRWYRS